MSGPNMQLSLNKTGVDNFIVGNPQITFFKSVFRRYTNFALESRKINFNGTPNFGAPNTCIISKGPDLLHKLYLQIDLPSITTTIATDTHIAFRWLNWVGHRLIKYVKIMIDGQEIDRHHGEWLHLWNELSQKVGHREAYAEMVGNVPKLTQIVTAKGDATTAVTAQTLVDGYTLHIPLQFWFCRNPGLSIPLVALKNSEVSIDLEFEEFNNLIWGSQETPFILDNGYIRNATGSDILSTNPSLGTVNLCADYIYLDRDEQRRFVNSEHDYLIEVIQERGTQYFDKNSSARTFNLTFTHPVKELVWIIQPKDFTSKDFCQPRGGMQPFNFTDEYDYAGFSGTPQPSSGTGMTGGRNNYNTFYNLPGVKLPFEKDVYEPNFSISDITSDNNFTTDKSKKQKSSANVSTLKTIGYDYISKYHSGGSIVNKYHEKSIEHYLGNTGAIKIDNTDSLDTGIWSNAGLNMRLLHRGNNPVVTASMFLNSVRRFDTRNGFYFNTIQPYQHHTNTPAVGINVYSFALEPENTQPSGTCNFTNIDNGYIEVNLTETAQKRDLAMRVYALSYNILQIRNNQANISYQYDYAKDSFTQEEEAKIQNEVKKATDAIRRNFKVNNLI
jgi:hypothetical protein